MRSKRTATVFVFVLGAASLKAIACVSNPSAPPAEGVDAAFPATDAAAPDTSTSPDTGTPFDAAGDGAASVDSATTDAPTDSATDSATSPTGFDAACPPNGVDAGGQCLVELATGFTSVYGIAVDSTNVYFAATSSDGGGAIMKVPINGGPVVPIAQGQANPQNVAVDSQNVYWADVPADAGGGTGSLNQVSKNGGTIVPLASGSLSTLPGTPTSMVSDGTNVYFTAGVFLDNGGYPLLQSGTVAQVPVGGGTVTTIASAAGPYAVAIDATNVYWTDYATGANDGQVLKAPKGGFTDGGIPQVLVYAVGAPAPLAVDSTNVYFGTLGYPAWIYSVPVDGDPEQTQSELEVLLGNEYPWGFAIDSANVYFTNLFQPGGSPAPQSGASGVINVIAKDGGVPLGWTDAGVSGSANLYAHGLVTPTGYSFLGPLIIAVDPYNVYWTDTAGSVWQISKVGGPF